MFKNTSGLAVPAFKVTGNMGGAMPIKAPGVPVKMTGGTSKPAMPKMPMKSAMQNR